MKKQKQKRKIEKKNVARSLCSTMFVLCLESASTIHIENETLRALFTYVLFTNTPLTNTIRSALLRTYESNIHPCPILGIDASE